MQHSNDSMPICMIGYVRSLSRETFGNIVKKRLIVLELVLGRIK